MEWNGWGDYVYVGGDFCNNPSLLAQNPPYYEDFIFYIQWWDINAPDNIYFHQVTTRVLHECYSTTITMAQPINRSIYAGALCVNAGRMSTSSFSPTLRANCPKEAYVEVQAPSG